MTLSRVLKIEDLCVDFLRNGSYLPAVSHLSYELFRGRTLGIVGESGSGKSVSTLCIMQLLPPAPKCRVSGSIHFFEHSRSINLLSLSEDEMRHYRGNRISMIFQEPMTSLNPVQKCGAQVVEMLQQHDHVSNKEARKRVLALFDEVLLPRPEKIFDSYPHEISGGQKQRVMIAMALICHPDIIIADEPTTALDVTVQKTILELLRQLQSKYNIGIIFITHDLGVIAQIADDVAVMYHGEVVEQGSAQQVLYHPQHPYTQGLLACRPPLDSRPRRLPTVKDFLEGNAPVESLPPSPSQHSPLSTSPSSPTSPTQPTQTSSTQPTQASSSHLDQASPAQSSQSPSLQQPLTTPTQPTQASSSQSPSLQQPPATPIQPTQASPSQSSNASPAQHPQTPLIQVRDLEVTYALKKNIFGKVLQELKAVDKLSFDIFPGETLGLVGESGCGKSTLGRSLLRLIDHSSGTIHYRGRSLDTLSSSEMRALRPKLQIIFQDPYSSLNPRIPVGEAILEPLRNYHLYDSDEQRRQRVLELMQQVGLEADWYGRYPHEFSGGQRQRVCIARALVLQPELVICDESVSALDVSVQAQVLNLLNDLKEHYGFTYLFITHDLSVVKFLSDRIMVMEKGHLVEMNTADELYAHPQHPYTQRLIASLPKL